MTCEIITVPHQTSHLPLSKRASFPPTLSLRYHAEWPYPPHIPGATVLLQALLRQPQPRLLQQCAVGLHAHILHRSHAEETRGERSTVTDLTRCCPECAELHD